MRGTSAWRAATSRRGSSSGHGEAEGIDHVTTVDQGPNSFIHRIGHVREIESGQSHVVDTDLYPGAGHDGVVALDTGTPALAEGHERTRRILDLDRDPEGDRRCAAG